MKILLLTTHVNTGGITSYILTLGDALVKSGHQVIVVSSGGDCESRLQAMGIRHLNLNIRTKSELHPKLWSAFGELKKLIQEEKISIIHAQTRVTQVLGFFLSRATGVSMITTCHGFFRPRWFRRIFPCWGEAVIAISKPVAKHLNVDFNVPKDKVHLIANGVDLNRFELSNEQKRQAARQLLNIGDLPLIGIIARFSDVKGIDILIKAMPIVLQQLPSARLIIAGQGPYEAYLKKLSQDLSLTGCIDFKDIINQPEVLLPAFDVFVMPSIMEGLGLSVMEAQACGIPVVASRVGGLIDLIEDGKSGYLIVSGDPTALAQKIIEVLSNPQQSKVMAQQARSNIEKNFSVKSMFQQTCEIYEQHSSH